MTDDEKQELVDRCSSLLMQEGVSSTHKDGRVYRFLAVDNLTTLLSFKPALKLEALIYPNPDTSPGAGPSALLFEQRGSEFRWGQAIDQLGPVTLRTLRELVVLDDLANA